MTSVERLKFLADKGDECWLGLSNVEAIKDVLKELEISKKETQQVLDDYQDLGKEYHKLECELEKAEKVIDEMANSLIGIGLYDIKVGQKFYFNEEEVKEYFYKKVSDNKWLKLLFLYQV